MVDRWAGLLAAQSPAGLCLQSTIAMNFSGPRPEAMWLLVTWLEANSTPSGLILCFEGDVNGEQFEHCR